MMSATVSPDIALSAATTHDSRSVTVDYSISGADVSKPIVFRVDRSATPTLGADGVVVGVMDVSSTTRDAAGISATAKGTHELTFALPGGLPPDPKQPFVVVTADPDNTIAESSKSDNEAEFRTYVIGVVTHGGLQDKKFDRTGVPWANTLADKMTSEGYDAVIPFNWVAVSGHAGAAAEVAPKLEAMIVQAASRFPSDAPVDIHFVGHSEGAVVNSQALLEMNQAGLPQNVKAGYLKMTMIDPHAANNGVKGPQYSVAEGPLGWLAKQEIINYQSRAQDPPVIVPPNVQDAEVFYQHTPELQVGTNNGLYNLWGQVPIHGDANYYDLTAKGVSHAG